MTSTSAGTLAQVLGGLLIAVLLEGRVLAQNLTRPNPPATVSGWSFGAVFEVILLFNVLIGMTGATVGLSLTVSSFVRDEEMGPVSAALALCGTAAAVTSVVVPAFAYAVLVFVGKAQVMIRGAESRRLFTVFVAVLMLATFSSVMYLLVTSVLAVLA